MCYGRLVVNASDERARLDAYRADTSPLTRDEIADVERLIERDDAEWGWFLQYVPRLLAEVKQGRFMS